MRNMATIPYNASRILDFAFVSVFGFRFVSSSATTRRLAKRTSYLFSSSAVIASNLERNRAAHASAVAARARATGNGNLSAPRESVSRRFPSLALSLGAVAVAQRLRAFRRAVGVAGVVPGGPEKREPRERRARRR